MTYALTYTSNFDMANSIQESFNNVLFTVYICKIGHNI